MKFGRDGSSSSGECPHHGIDFGIQVQAFYNGVNMGVRQLIDTYAGMSTDTKTPQEVYDLIKHIVVNNYTWGSSRSRAAGVYYDHNYGVEISNYD